MNTRSATRSGYRCGVSARAAERSRSGPSSMTRSTSVTVGSAWPALRSSRRSMARPRMTSSALVIRLAADQRGQRHQQRQPPRPDLPAAAAPLRPGHRGQGGAERPGVERVDPVQAAADPDDLPAEVADQRRVVGFGVAEDQHPGAERDRTGDQPLDQGGFAGAGLAEDEHPGVGDQPGAQPGQRVEADDLAPELVPADRGPGGRGAAARDEREQPAELGGGGLVLRAGATRGRPGRRRGSSIPRLAGAAARRARRPAARDGPARSGGDSPRRSGREAGWPVRRWAARGSWWTARSGAAPPLRYPGGCAAPIGVGGVRHGGSSVSAGSGGRVRAGRCRTGRVAVNPAAWLRYRRCSRILEDSAAASVSAAARASCAGSVTVTVTYRPSRLTPAPRASSSAACRARAWSWASRAVTSRRVRRAYSLAELRRPHLAVQRRGGRVRGQRPVLQADPLGEGARAEEAGQHVGGDVLPGRFPPGPGHRGAAVVLVAVPAFLGPGRARAGPVQLLLQRGADPGGQQAADLAAHRRVERGAHHARRCRRRGPGPAR